MLRFVALALAISARSEAASPANTPTTAPDPLAPPAAVVTSADGRARFTILTPALARMEYAADGSFDDRATLAIVNRNPATVPHFTHATQGKELTIVTSALKITYTSVPVPPAPPASTVCTDVMPGHDAYCSEPNGQPRLQTCGKFRSPSAPQGLQDKTQAECCAACAAAGDCRVWVHSSSSASTPAPCYLLTKALGGVSSANRTVGGDFGHSSAPGFSPQALRVEGLGSLPFKWSPGQIDSGNLLGTARSLDGITGGIDLNCTNDNNTGYCAFGPISRDGWAVVDDSANDRVDSTVWILPYNASARNGSAYSDLYFFGYGHDYKSAMGAYRQIAGAAPMPPRFALGVWWSRYWPYTAEDLEDIARGYHEHSIPLDVLVSDMAWHYHGEAPVDWGGYTWSPQLFPEPEAFLQSLSTWGLNLTLNLHLRPVDPTAEDPQHYSRFVQELGLSLRPEQNISIPSDASPPYTGSVAELLVSSRRFATAYLSLLDRMGTNFWWLDDEPKWVARILYEHSASRMEKGLAFARWAGLGSHRYPIGFSGDTYMEWRSLAFQPYFTATAANVAFWWSHDIGGHLSTVDAASPRGHTDAAYDPELYLRWLQWGAHSPIMRTHPQPDPAVERRAWGYSLPYSEYMRAAFARRARLVPLIYTSLHEFEATGVSPLHPVYYDAPEAAGAYDHLDTYIYCDDLLVAPVTAPQHNTTQLAERKLWLPPGAWVDTVSGTEITSNDGVEITRSYVHSTCSFGINFLHKTCSLLHFARTVVT